MTPGNANVAGDICHDGDNNFIVSSNNANVAGDIRYAGCCIANAGDRNTNAGNYINNAPIQQRPVTLATPPAAFVHLPQANYYTEIAL